MPMYDVECPRCGRVVEVFCPMAERNQQRCCNGTMRVLIRPPAAHVWKPDWYWMGSKERVFVRSKRQLFEECRQRDKVAVCHDQAWKSPQHPPRGGLKTAAECYQCEGDGS